MTSWIYEFYINYAINTTAFRFFYIDLFFWISNAILFIEKMFKKKFLNESKIYLLFSFFNKYKTRCTDLARINLEV